MGLGEVGMPKPDDLSYLDVDETDLTAELGRQPRLIYWACEKEADARHEHSQLKSRLDVVEAELKLAVRRSPKSFGIEEPKPTEGTVGATVLLQPQYQQALADLNDAKHKLDVFSGRVAAVQDKRRALERRIELMSIHYWNEEVRPRTATAREAVADMSKDSTRRPLRRERSDA